MKLGDLFKQPHRIIYLATAQVTEGAWQGAYTDVEIGVRNAFLETFKEGETIKVTIESYTDVQDRTGGVPLDAICQAALEKYGQQAQVDMCIEECAELINALEKWRRGRNNSAEVCTEIADVLIMCHQMMEVFGVNETHGLMTFKLNRLVDRMGGVENGK